MTSRLKTLVAAGLASLVLSLTFPLQSSAAEQCQAQIDSALQQHGVSADDIESMKVVKQSRGAKAYLALASELVRRYEERPADNAES